MALHAFLQVGLSFADIGLFDGDSLKAHQRFYLPKELLGNSLKKFWSEHGEPQKLTVSSRFLEKILDAKLGGTVAQIVTSGFETWPILRQPVLPNRFVIKPYRQEPLASQDLIFGISERVGPDGQVLKPVELSELEFINSKLKLMSVKRVCVNLLFSHLNPTHQEQVAKYFEEQGFEVFACQRSDDSRDEMPAWRKNVINACLSGAFTEHLEEIQKSFSDPGTPLVFLNHEGREFSTDKNHIAGSLFAWAHALSENLKTKADQILYVGLENWFLVHNHERCPHWDSPWGAIESTIPKVQKLEMQPTSKINSGFWGGIHFSENELGYEPGPMSFGRALKPTVFDLLNEKFQTGVQQVQPQATHKFRDQLNALIKNIPELNGMTVDKLIQNMSDHLVTLLSMECQMKAPHSKKIWVTGLFAPFFYAQLQKKWFASELILDPQATTREIHALKGLA
jgi:N-methylhydantoinase A